MCSTKNHYQQNIRFDLWTTYSPLRISDTFRKVSIEHFMETAWPTSLSGSINETTVKPGDLRPCSCTVGLPDIPQVQKWISLNFCNRYNPRFDGADVILGSEQDL